MQSNQELAYAGFTQEQLKLAFDIVKPKDHWKNPIQCEISALADKNAISAAITFFTGSIPDFEENADGSFTVYAVGYFAAIGS